MNFNELDDSQMRGAINLGDAYDGWLSDARVLETGRLRWKRSGEGEYLYQMRKGSDSGTSLGSRTQDTEALFQEGQLREQRCAATEKTLLVKARLYRTLGLPLIDHFAAKVLRALDVSGLLGTSVRVVGSCALPAYELEANALLPKTLLATEDFDMAWVGQAPTLPLPSLLAVLKKADETWTVREDRSFQVRNSVGQMIDLVMAEHLEAGYPQRERLRALATAGQEYLLGGTPVSQVVSDTRGTAARIVAPDPRLFALHKFHLAQQPGREKKRTKDIAQAHAVLALVKDHMPHYPLDEEFRSSLPPVMAGHFDRWCDQQPATSAPPGRRATP